MPFNTSVFNEQKMRLRAHFLELIQADAGLKGDIEIVGE
jgi:hypothetical protein